MSMAASLAARTGRFLGTDPKLLGFGITAAFASSFGQTYFIALSGGAIRDTFDLGHGDFGAVYSTATLASAGALIWTGKLIDRIDLRLWTSAIILALAAACALMSQVESVALLLVTLFMLRHFGQGLLSHTGATSLARYFTTGRGRAIGMAGAGYPLGEALFPLAAVALMAAVGWREMWLIAAGAMLVGFLPAQLALLGGHGARQRDYVARLAREEEAERAAAATRPSGMRGPHWTRAEVLRDPRFHLVMPAMLAPSFIITGIFFHQVHIVEVKGWSLAWYSAAFVAYAAATVPAGLIYGVVIDRIGAARALPYFLPGMVIACIVLATGDHPLTVWIFMIFGGANAGMTQTLGSALWAEVYGVRHLGAIRALTTACMVFSTAASPFILGALIDAGLDIETILLLCAGYAAIGVGLSIAGRGRYAPRA
ncbi:MFS transporter [Marivibrio halodurans]|uniref:MFS transporter n=2 Tax=Marivibrio halodurans TaxID=2039722 RepID=A0A8J7V1M0_9PROT|nr:MFS transporter [Marivibrio halodurans]MBP5857926.1 MFS transporter [Marivibrio halodurans]